MPLLQGIIQILMEHTDLIWKGNNTKRNQGSKTDRPFSVLFIGKELTPTIQQDSAFAKAKRAYLDASKLIQISPSNPNNNLREKSQPFTDDKYVPILNLQGVCLHSPRESPSKFVNPSDKFSLNTLPVPTPTINITSPRIITNN